MTKNTNRFELLNWNTHFAIVDWQKDGQIIKIYKNKKSCHNKVWDLNNSKSPSYIETQVKKLIHKI